METVKNKTYMNWSTGKDSALALYHTLNHSNYSVGKLLTSINSHFDRVSMHGIRRELLDRQIQQISIPNETIELPQNPSMSDYDKIMQDTVVSLQSEGYTHSVFGDIFLENLKKYREDKLAEVGITAFFPLWKRNTKELIKEFLSLGFKAIVVTVDASVLDESFLGREIDNHFLNDLPKTVDPCGENGEFHTFCFSGPIFKNLVEFKLGETVFRKYQSSNLDGDKNICEINAKGFWYLDLLPS